VLALAWGLRSYDQLKIKYESDQRRRERAQLVAELLAEWKSTPVDGDPMHAEQRKRINQLSFEATLWLPEEIAIELSKVLQHDPTALNQLELLLRVRKLLSGPHNLTVKNITQWARDRELQNRGLPDGFKNGQITAILAEIEHEGQIKPIEWSESTPLFSVPKGAKVLLTMPKAESPIVVKAADIQGLRLLQRKDANGTLVELLLEVFPKDLANELNRSLYGGTHPIIPRKE
jgi:hypothetical protein